MSTTIILSPLTKVFTSIKNELAHRPVLRTVCLVVIIKLIIMFFILRPIFFPDFLGSKCKDNREKANYVSTRLVNISRN